MLAGAHRPSSCRKVKTWRELRIHSVWKKLFLTQMGSWVCAGAFLDQKRGTVPGKGQGGERRKFLYGLLQYGGSTLLLDLQAWEKCSLLEEGKKGKKAKENPAKV